jgi:hemolysin activation/secretion protein
VKSHNPSHNQQSNSHIFLALLMAVGTPNAWAQTPSPADQQQQLQQLRQQLDNLSRDRVPAPLPTTPKFDLRIQAPEKSAVPKSIEEIQFEVKGYEFEGMTFVSTARALAFFEGTIGQKVSLDAVRKGSEALEALYREQGFFLTRVFIPPQQVKDGVFKIRVIEGAIGQVFVEGADEGINQQVLSLAKSLIGKKPLDLASLERVLLLINDIPGASGSGVLRQGSELGASDLVITTSPGPDINLVTMNNTGSNATGPFSMSYNGTFQQPLSLNGSLNVGVTGTGSQLQEVQSTTVRYSRALGGSGLQGSIGGIASRALPGGTVSRALGLQSDIYSISGRLRYPVQRSRTSSVYFDTGLSLNRSTTKAPLGPMEVQQAINKGDKSTVAEATVSWALNGWMDGIQNVNLSFFHGTTLFNAFTDANEPTTATPGFEPRFKKFASTFTRTQTLPNKFSLQTIGQVQYTRDKLSSSELIGFGGPFIGRGFDPGAISGDRGWGGLLELRYDSDVNVMPTIGKIQFYLSYDHGVVRATQYEFLDRSDPTNPTTANAGGTQMRRTSKAMGMRFPLLKDNLLDVQLADAFKEINGEGVRGSPRFLVSAVVRF